MSISLATPAELTEAYYTICPLLVASNIAVEKNWLDEEFERAGANPIYLRSLPENKGWLPHFRHSLPNLIRDGGAVPSIWAKADLTDTLLIATTASQKPGLILVRADSKIRSVKQLAGRRFGIPRSLNRDRVDVLNSFTEQTLQYSLERAGLTRDDVQIVEIEDKGDPAVLQPAARPAALWSQLRGHHRSDSIDVRALADNHVDAVVIQTWQAPALLATGAFTVIEDLDLQPDWTLKNVNGPYLTVVNRTFAQSNPEVVVAFLRAAIRAGNWINNNRDEAAEIFTRVTLLPDASFIRQALGNLDFVPQLSAQNLAAVKLKKDFLYSRGYLANDFNVDDWVSGEYLQQAHDQLGHI